MHISTVSILQILFLDKLFFLIFYQFRPYSCLSIAERTGTVNGMAMGMATGMATAGTATGVMATGTGMGGDVDIVMG